MPFGRPMYVMLKPVGDRCNLACQYCYYSGKGSGAVMDDALLEEFTRQYIEAQTVPQVLFTWHGGEPLLRPLAFYERALELQRKYAGGRHIDNCLQTNGTLLNDDWCRFLRDNHFLVGISIDGPQSLPPAPSRRRGSFRGDSWHDVMRGISLLQRHGVEWNAMATVNAANVEYPVEFYEFFRQIGCEFLQFTPIVEPDKPDCSITADQWGRFLCGVYDEWVRRDVGRIFVQLFDATLANWVGVEPGVCSMAAFCGNALAMEHNGDVFSCDHFVFPEYRLGNIFHEPLASMAYGERQNGFRRLKQQLPEQCRRCRFEFAGHGECPKNRLLRTSDGEAGLNYLCEGYRRFFEHAAPYMDFMAREWREDGAPARVMEAVAKGLFSRQGPVG